MVGKWRKTIAGMVLALMSMFIFWGASCERTVVRDGIRMRADEARRLDLDQAGAALEAGRYDEAVSRYRRFLEDWPRSPEGAEALAGMGEASYKQGDQEEARRIFNDVIARYPDQPAASRAAWGLALDAFGRDDCATVERLVNDYRAMAPDPTWDRMTLLLAECKIKSGEKTTALYLYGEEVRSGRDSKLSAEARTKAEALAPSMDEATLENVANQHPTQFPGDLALLELVRKLLAGDELDKANALIKTFENNHPQSPYLSQLAEARETVSMRSKVKFNRIGILLPTSGRLAGYGERALKGIILAGDVFNSGSPMMPVDFIIRDSANQDQIEALVTELVVEQFVIAIVGPLRTSTAERAARKAQELRVPLVTLSPSENIAEMGDMIYQNCLTKKPQAAALADYAVTGQDLKKIGMLFPNDDYGQEFADLFSREVEAQGGEIVSSQSYDSKTTDFRAEISSLKGQGGSEGVQALFIPDSWEKIAMIAPQLRFYQLTGVRLLGINAWHDDKLMTKIQPEDLVQAAFSDGFAPELMQPAFNDFSRRYSEQFNESPDLVTAQSYETVDLIVHLIEEYRVRDREQLQSALDHVARYPGVLGSITADSAGRFQKPIYIFTPSEGKFRVIATYE